MALKGAVLLFNYLTSARPMTLSLTFCLLNVGLPLGALGSLAAQWSIRRHS